MAITTLNNRSINRSDTAASGQLWTATSATASDFQAAAAGGKVGQVIQALDNTERTTSSSSFVDMSSTLVGVITPAATSSKIWVQVTVSMQSTLYSWTLGLFKDVAGAGYAQIGEDFLEIAGAQKGVGGTVINYLDSPSSTSALSYRPYFKISGGTFYLNYSATQGTIQVAEILA